MIDDTPPMPKNKPYYSDAFRQSLIPESPAVSRVRGGQVLTYQTFPQKRSVQSVSRQWTFSENALELLDRISGSGKHKLRRQFIVPGKAVISPDGPIFEVEGSAYRFDTGVVASTLECTKWEAYGSGSAATKIILDEVVTLPFEGKTIIGKYQRQ